MTAPHSRTPKRYPFATLAIDGEFSVPLSGELTADYHDRAAARLTAAAARYARHHGRRFSCRVDHVLSVVRCRRIA